MFTNNYIFIKSNDVLLRRTDISIYFLAFLTAITFYIISSPNNLGFSMDSVSYLEGANNILKGKGFVNDDGQLINHWPPFFSVMLALFSLILNIEPIQSGIILNASLIFGTIIILKKILDLFNVRSLFSFLAILSILLSAPMKVFLWYLSEGLFIFLLLIVLYFILLWHTSPNLKHLIFAGILSGLLLLTRFAGVSFIFTFLLIIFYHSETYFNKLKNLASYILPIFLIAIPWLVYASLMKENPQDREFAIHIISTEKLYQIYSVIKYWFVGNYFSAKLLPFVLILLSILLFLKSTYIKSLLINLSYLFRNKYLAIILNIFIYLTFIVFSASFFDNGIPFDNRILFPVFVLLFLLIVKTLQIFYDSKMPEIGIITGLFLFTSFTLSGYPVYKNFYIHGLGYSAKTVKKSETLQYARNLKNVEIYSNHPAVFDIHSNIETFLLPNKNNKYDFVLLQKKLEKNQAEIIIFYNLGWPDYLLKSSTIQEKFKNYERLNFKDGYIIKSLSK